MRKKGGPGGEYEDGELGSGVGVWEVARGNSLSEELGSVRKADPNKSWEELDLDLDLGVRGGCGCGSVGELLGRGGRQGRGKRGEGGREGGGGGGEYGDGGWY